MIRARSTPTISVDVVDVPGELGVDQSSANLVFDITMSGGDANPLFTVGVGGSTSERLPRAYLPDGQTTRVTLEPSISLLADENGISPGDTTPLTVYLDDDIQGDTEISTTVDWVDGDGPSEPEPTLDPDLVSVVGCGIPQRVAPNERFNVQVTIENANEVSASGNISWTFEQGRQWNTSYNISASSTQTFQAEVRPDRASFDLPEGDYDVDVSISVS